MRPKSFKATCSFWVTKGHLGQIGRFFHCWSTGVFLIFREPNCYFFSPKRNSSSRRTTSTRSCLCGIRWSGWCPATTTRWWPEHTRAWRPSGRPSKSGPEKSWQKIGISFSAKIWRKRFREWSETRWRHRRLTVRLLKDLAKVWRFSSSGLGFESRLCWYFFWLCRLFATAKIVDSRDLVQKQGIFQMQLAAKA